MTPEQFQDKLAKWQRDYENQKSVILEEIGNKAVELFRQNFDNEGFFGQHWKNRKNKSAAQNTKILQKNSVLVNSFQVEVKGDTVTVSSDLPYSKIHNEGGTIKQTVTKKQQAWMGANWKKSKKAGSEMTIKIPQRQFMGDHSTLRAELKKYLEEELIKIFN
ncbi:MAG: phage virion morphogenesis protein [Prevotellaceae bacterium]|jgi:phage gpG-like protein|nr:phage virion morphogenesis protein [Prevotellaceae bacterium]